MERYEYSLIRAVPDPRRGEWVNIGVCVYLQGFLDIRIAESMAKVRALDPNFDSRIGRNIEQDWNSAAGYLDDASQKQMLLGSLPTVHASPVAQFVSEPEDYETQINAILRDLVVPPAAVREKKEARLQATLKAHLKKAKLYSDDPSAISRHKVVSHFPVKKEANLYADFAAKNGVMHITETIDFRVKADQLRNRHGHAAIKSITLDVAGTQYPNCNRNVVYAFHKRDAEIIEPSLNLLRDYSMHMFNADNRKELASFVEMTADALDQRLI